jgi:hypothetical protein
MKRNPRRFFRLVVRGAFILAGLYGGWLAAGAMNNQRIDLPRSVMPTTSPSH